MNYLIILLLFFTKIALGCDSSTFDVNSIKNISAKVSLKDNDLLSVSVLDGAKLINSEDINVSSEKKNHIKLEDYNQDGYKDFSVWHLDEGMGTYKIYRLFIFSQKKMKFNEIKPTCGDDFINIRIDGSNLINVFYDGDVPKFCAVSIKSLK